MTKLLADDVKDMRRRCAAGMYPSALADEYRVSATCAFDAITGRSWKWILDPPPIDPLTWPYGLRKRPRPPGR